MRYFAIFLLILAMAGGYCAYDAYRFLHTPADLPGVDIHLEVERGATFDRVAWDLKKSGLITDVKRFRLLARYKKALGSIKAGEYILNTSLTPPQILEQLLKGQAHLVRLTIREGLPWWETARTIEKQGFATYEDFKAVIHDPGFLARHAIPFENAEGFLFPDTYLLNKPKKLDREQAEYIASLLVRTFWKKNTPFWQLLEASPPPHEDFGASVVDITSKTTIKTLPELAHHSHEVVMRAPLPQAEEFEAAYGQTDHILEDIVEDMDDTPDNAENVAEQATRNVITGDAAEDGTEQPAGNANAASAQGGVLSGQDTPAAQESDDLLNDTQKETQTAKTASKTGNEKSDQDRRTSGNGKTAVTEASEAQASKVQAEVSGAVPENSDNRSGTESTGAASALSGKVSVNASEPALRDGAGVPSGKDANEPDNPSGNAAGTVSDNVSSSASGNAAGNAAGNATGNAAGNAPAHTEDNSAGKTANTASLSSAPPSLPEIWPAGALPQSMPKHPPQNPAEIDKNALRQAMTLASLVEKETGLPSERPRVAGVYANRIAKSMLLQCDPTIIYGIGPDFSGPIRRSQLRDASNLYNTYIHAGLPPSPICSFGVDAFASALLPEKHDYLFFVATGKGKDHTFSKTLREHNRAVSAYRARMRDK